MSLDRAGPGEKRRRLLKCLYLPRRILIWFFAIALGVLGAFLIFTNFVTPWKLHGAGSWAAGIAYGNSPFSGLQPSLTPLLTREEATDVKATFVADPFVIKVPKERLAHLHGMSNSDRWFLFFEVMNGDTANGDLAVASFLDPAQPRIQYHQVVIDEPFHLSYPQIFEHDGQYYMIPESHKNLSVRLYRAVEFPHRWVLHRQLLTGEHYIDPTIVYHNGRWYLFVFLLPPVMRIYSSNDLLTGEFVECKGSPHYEIPHPRCGGPIFTHENKLYRTAQDKENVFIYGDFIRLMEITRLDPDGYKEHEVAQVRPSESVDWASNRLHQFDYKAASSSQPGFAIIDGNYRLFSDNLACSLAIIMYVALVLILAATIDYATSAISLSSVQLNARMMVCLFVWLLAISILCTYLLRGNAADLPPLKFPASEEARDEQISLHNVSAVKFQQKVSCPVTLVTSLVDTRHKREPIDSRALDGFAKSLRYFQKILKQEVCMTIFIEPYLSQFVWMHREKLGTKTEVILVDHNTLRNYTYYSRISQLLNDSVKPGRLQENSLRATYELQKYEWLHSVSQRNPFGSENFFWVDGDFANRVYLRSNTHWPSYSKVTEHVDPERLFIVQVQYHFPKDCLQMSQVAARNTEYFSTAFFGGSNSTIKNLYSLWHETLTEQLSNGYMHGTKLVFFGMYCKAPWLFGAIRCPDRYLLGVACAIADVEVCVESYHCPAFLFAD